MKWYLVAALFLFSSCLWRDMEGNTYLSAPVLDPWDYDAPQVQLNQNTRYQTELERP